MKRGHGKLYLVGLGPGSPEQMTAMARSALQRSDLIVGYRGYLELIAPILEGKELLSTGTRQEVERCRAAVEAAEAGRVVAVVSSGDPGVYGMAGLVYELLRERGWGRQEGPDVEVVPGVTALNAAAALLGAPLMHDFAAISLSDLPTPWETIARRLELASQADFVIGLYNPRSTRRVQPLADAHLILSKYRGPETPVGVVRCGYRDGQQVTVTDLSHLLEAEVDMQTIVVVGNSSTASFQGVMVTPRGYGTRYDLGRTEL